MKMAPNRLPMTKKICRTMASLIGKTISMAISVATGIMGPIEALAAKNRATSTS